MKKIIPLFAMMLLAGCGKNSSGNQLNQAAPPASEQSPNPGVANSPATNSSEMTTNGPGVTNPN